MSQAVPGKIANSRFLDGGIEPHRRNPSVDLQRKDVLAGNRRTWSSFRAISHSTVRTLTPRISAAFRLLRTIGSLFCSRTAVYDFKRFRVRLQSFL